MKNKKIVFAVVSALTFSATPVLAASSDRLFNDVPTDHWAYQAVEQLAKDGILTGYNDASFKGDSTVTRYEMAQIVANARTHMQKASAPDQDIINKLSDEFRDDLDALGVRVARLEKKQENVRITGSFQQKYEHAYHAGIANTDYDIGREKSSHWRKELKLNLDAMLPKTPLTFHTTLTTQLDSYKGNGFNTEEAEDENWNGGHERPNIMRPETYYVGGPIDKTGLDGRFGAFYTEAQGDFVNHAVTRGFLVSSKHGKDRFSAFTGRLDVKDRDGSSTVTEGSSDHTFTESDIDWAGGATLINQTETSYVQSYNIKASSVAAAAASVSSDSASTDFLRHHKAVSGASASPISTAKTYRVIQTATGSNWDYDWSNPTYDYREATYSTSGRTISNPTRRRTLSGLTYGHAFSDRTDLELGYYTYKSAAYDQDILRIYSARLNQKLSKKMNLMGAYARGNQHGYDQAWTAELEFNGAPNMPSADNHRFGYYIGYRYLAPDALVKTVYEDGAQVGQRGWEGGLYYNFCHNLQGAVKYFNGSSITNPGQDRSKWFSTLTFDF